ncbi:MAG: molecular chaperone HtpG [Magnetococcus sp. WYHC-3]
MTVNANPQTFQFQTEVRQLLDLMIHSLYSNKEIFLRELISNASDACDKLRFEALANDALYEGRADLGIRITMDKDARTLTVADDGIGMSREEVISNIGTIARSGTREFLGRLSGDQKADAHLIGQFGVGFYSSFIVADRVTLLTRRAGSTEAVRWSSAGDGEYTLEAAEKPGRGTEVTLHLREDESEFLDGWRLRSIVRKFSDHIPLPIQMEEHRWSEDDKEEGKDGEEVPQGPRWETVNKASALWTRPAAELKEEDYHAFYQHVAHDYQPPLAHVHARLEGKYEYILLLYLPQSAPFNLYDQERKHGVKLYVRRVFISEGAEELMPRYLRFVRGVIDSADLPLNVSREILQQNRAIEAMRKGAVGKVFGLLEDLASREPEKYATFWRHFGNVLKEGVIEDHANRERIAKLLRFASTAVAGETPEVSLEQYVARMKPGQERIYFVTGETRAAAAGSPHLEIFRRKGVEVLLLGERIDEWLVGHLTEFQGKKLQSVSRGDLDLSAIADAADAAGTQTPPASSADAGQYAPLLERLRGVLGDTVKEVRLSQRLTDSPSCLVAGDHDMSAAMERLLKAAGQEVTAAKRVLELNADHPLVARLKEETDSARLERWGRLLYEQALLSEGGQPDSPAGFVRRMNELLVELAS